MQVLKKITSCVFLIFWGMVCFSFPVKAAKTSANPSLVIALDPGHGGEEEGAMYYGLMEKDINYKMAELVKRELERYPNVTVFLTRNGDEQVSLLERADRAKEADADILLSLHFNASAFHHSQGASVYISTGEMYRNDLRQFADYLLGEFEAMGLNNAGTFARVTQMGGRRADGTFDDYYGILRHSYNNGMPSMIIEHCYMDAEADKAYFYEQEGLEKLAKADVNAIAAYYKLTDADGEGVTPKHAKKFGATTKALEKNYYEAPNITGIRLIDYDGKTPGMAEFEVEVEDGAGITSVYLVYKNTDTEETVTVSLACLDSLTTGTHRLGAYIPAKLELGNYTLSYIGAYNEAGYDAGYNISGAAMLGFGKCDWLNRFRYSGEADFTVKEKTVVSDAYARKLIHQVKDRLQRERSISLFPMPSGIQVFIPASNE